MAVEFLVTLSDVTIMIHPSSRNSRVGKDNCIINAWSIYHIISYTMMTDNNNNNNNNNHKYITPEHDGSSRKGRRVNSYRSVSDCVTVTGQIITRRWK